MQPFILDLAICPVAGIDIGKNYKVMDERGEKYRMKGDRLDGLFFQQAEFYGMCPAAAFFFVARALVIGTAFSCGQIVIATVVVVILFSFLVGHRRKGRMGGSQAFAMAYGVKVGCKHSQQK